jgi:hypothetical protein
MAKMGRPKGSRNKATADITAALRKHTPEMIKELVRLAKQAEHEATRLLPSRRSSTAAMDAQCSPSRAI